MNKKFLTILFICLFVSSCSYSYADQGYDWYFDKINYDALKNVPKTKDIRVGVIDSGFDDSYANLLKEGAIVDPYDFIDNDTDVHSPINLHGTHVALLIASQKWNYVSGIDDDLKIVPIRVVQDDGTTNKDLILKALQYAKEKGCDVVNMSFGSTTPDPEIEEFIKAKSVDSWYVASAGDLSSKSFLYPANFNGVLAVQAMDKEGKLYEYSNTSEETSAIKAPGVGIEMEVRHEDKEDTHTFLSGSSYATAIVSGILGSALRSEKLNKENLLSYDLYTNGFLDCSKFII